MSEYINLPPEQLSYKKKTKTWRKMHLDWADSKTFFNYSPVRKSVMHKKINYDLLNGKLHMEDLEQVLNPEALKSEYTPDRKQCRMFLIRNILPLFQPLFIFLTIRLTIIYREFAKIWE